MREQGTFETDLGIGRGRIHFGKREGKPFSQLSFIDVGDMNNDCEKTVPDGEKVEITILLNGMPATILLWPEKQKGSFTIPSIGFHRELSLQLVSEESGFAGHHFIVPEPNIERLKAHQDYIEEPGEKVLRFELGNSQVLAYVKGQGIEVEDRHDLDSCLAIMDRLCALIHQDGVNYTHDQENCGTIAQMEHAFRHDHYTNCRGLALILAGVLRAYGYRASAVECRPLSGDVHIVCEVYLENLHRWVMLDPTNNLVFCRDGEPLSLFGLRRAMVERAELEVNAGASHNGNEVDSISLLAFMSNKLFYFVKAIDSCEDKQIAGGNAICLTSGELLPSAGEWGLATNNLMLYYQA